MTGCTKARAETVPDGPPLATPAPPPRVLAPVELLAEAPPPLETPVISPPPQTVKPPVPRRQTPPAAETQKPPDPAPQPAAPAVAEAPAVRTPAPNPAEDRRINEILKNAQSTLASRVDYQKLTSDGKQQYEDAKRFAELAAGAIKDRDYPLAATLADKALTVAQGLLGR
jgi:hypothetical protein